MNENKPYTKREIDILHESIHEKLDRIILKVDYTNGKVKRIVLAIVAVGAFSVGLGLVQGKALLALFI